MDHDSITDPLNTGFKWIIPTHSSDTEYKNAGISWTISGHNMQVLSMTVPPGCRLMTEPGTFMFMHPHMDTGVDCTLCSNGFGGCARICGGESCIKVILGNRTHYETYAGVTPNFPAKIVPIRFDGSDIMKGNGIIAKPGAIMSEIGDIDVGCNSDCNCFTGCCSGLGFCRQSIRGKHDGIAFLAAGGTIVLRVLAPKEKFIVDANSIVAFEDSVSLGITPTGSCGMCCFGGEGCFYATLEGPGKVWIQSMSFEKFQDEVRAVTVEREHHDHPGQQPNNAVV